MSSVQALRRILHIHRDPALADRIRDRLGRIPAPRHLVAHYAHLVDAFAYLQVSPVDVVLAGPEPADDDLLETVRRLSASFPEIPVVALVEGDDPALVERLQKAGARDCLDPAAAHPEIWVRTFNHCLREMVTVRELAQVTARLDWLIHMDPLTGTLNRKGLERAIMDELGRCRPRGAELAVLLVDLDDFTRINATLGHGVGDMVLGAAARRINETLRPADKVGRCGTDRFMVVLPGSDLEDAEAVAEEIRLAISRDAITAGEIVLKTTASIGVAAISPRTLSFDEVLARAQIVLQRGKLEGKNRTTRAASVQDVNMITPGESGPDMVRALVRGRVLQVASQPIVNLTDGRIVSREMLIRGPRGPLHTPDNLFRFCQENDVLAAVDLRCLKLCASTAARLGPHARYHVNIMPATLLQTPVEELIRVLKVSGAEGHCVLEISEQQLLGDPTVLVGPVRRLQESGVGIAVDDVGFGNSCLEGLLMLQPEVMKVDKKLVRGLADDNELRRTLQRLLRVGAVLGAEIVAEGIENQADYNVLMDLGVRLGQGYLFGRPVLCEQDRSFPPPPPRPAPPPPEASGPAAAG